MSVFHGDREKSFAIKQPTSDGWPTNLGVFTALGDYTEPVTPNHGGRVPSYMRGRLMQWQASFWPREQSYKFPQIWYDGDSAARFWDVLRDYARTKGTVWIWAWDLWPAWCLLNGRREIDEERLILDIRERNDGSPMPGKRPLRSQGLFVAEDPPTIICVAVPGGGRIKLLDLANYGIRAEDYRIEEQAGRLSASVQAVKDFHKLCVTYCLGSAQTTAASQAWYAYRKSHMHHPIIVHPMSKVLEVEQAGYYGGRCECRRIGQFRERLYHLDVNSMYTALGMFAMYPHKYVATQIPIEDEPSNSFEVGMGTIADVTIRTNYPYWPARERVKTDPLGCPLRRRGRERIIYPVGTFRTVLAGPELSGAMEMGHVVEWHRVQYYEMAPIMQSWSQWALNMRATLSLHGLAHMSHCAKKIMNSLPGKWGQRQKKWVDFPTDCAAGFNPSQPDDWYQEWGKHPGNGEITPFRTIAGQTQYQDREELSATSCPAIAAYWTSYGRAFLLGGVLHARPENVFYYDTDSMIVNEHGYRLMVDAGLVDQHKPGAWKLKEENDNVEILGIRRYRFGDRWCVAGPFGGQIVGESLPPAWTEHEGFGSQLWHRSAGDAVQVKRMARWRKEYHHGVVGEQGNVEPFLVGPLDENGCLELQLG